MRKRWGAGALAAVICLLVAATAALAQELAPVTLASAQRSEIIQEVSLTGSLSAPRRARLAPEVDGRVTAIPVEAGDRVAAGDTLLELDATLSRLEVRQAEARARETAARLAEAERLLREARRLSDTASISRSETESRAAEVRRLEAVRARQRAQQAYQSEVLDRHTLQAPFAGVINERMTDLGERVATDTAVFELVSTERLRLDLAVPERHLDAVSAGTPLRIRFPALGAAAMDRAVDTVIPVADPNSRTFHARATLDNSDGRLMPGLSANATLRLDTGRDGVVVPQDALIRYPDGRTVVWSAEGEGETRTVRERQVETGLHFRGRVAITAGLDAGTPVVTAGNEALRDGQQVRVAERR